MALNLTKNIGKEDEKTYYAVFKALKVVHGEQPKHTLEASGDDEEMRLERIEGKINVALLECWDSKEIKELGYDPITTIAIQVFNDHDDVNAGNLLGGGYDAIKQSIDKFHPSMSYTDA